MCERGNEMYSGAVDPDLRNNLIFSSPTFTRKREKAHSILEFVGFTHEEALRQLQSKEFTVRVINTRPALVN